MLNIFKLYNLIFFKLKLNMKTFYLIILAPFFLQAQVGIGTTSPTEELDVNGDVRIRGLSNGSGVTSPVSALPDGTLVTASTSNSAPGTKFVGFLDSDINLDINNGFKEIILTNELFDVLNEYDNITGRYSPTIAGYYKTSMDFDIGDYTSTTIDFDFVIGLWDFTTNQWALRRIYKHRSINLFVGRIESYGISNYLQLQVGHSYGFRIIPSYDSTVTLDAKVKYQNGGATGISLSTSFSIEKVL